MTFCEFTTSIRLLCRVFGLSVTSWGRSAARNAAVGGRPDSWHLDFLAVDVVPDNANVLDQLRGASQWMGLEIIDEGDHWHIEPAGPRETRPG